MPRPSIPAGFTISLPPGDGSKATRLALAIVQLITEGRLVNGDRLPSTRALAVAAGVSRSVAVAAYDELTAAGYLTARPGAATMVDMYHPVVRRAVARRLADAAGDDSRGSAAASPSIVHDLIPGAPDVRLIDVRAWDSAWRQALRDARTVEPEPFDSPGTQGDSLPALRSALSRHLRSHRGVVSDPDDIWIFSGLAPALTAIAGALGLDDGLVAVEDPGNVCARRALEAAGCVVQPCDVDADGLQTEALTSADSAVYTTPSHHHPLGVGMSPTRRRALLAWAERTGGVVLEDDHDSQFRHRSSAPTPLRSMNGAEDAVIFLTSGSRLLSHRLDLTWAVVPRRFRSLFRQRFSTSDHLPSPVTTSAVRRFLDAGAFTLHIARAGRIYTRRRDRFEAACRGLLGGVEPTGLDTGMHGLLEFGHDVDDVGVAERLRRGGVACLPLSSFYAPGTGTPRRPGLVCGYGRLTESAIEPAVAAMADGLNDLDDLTGTAADRLTFG